MTSDDDPVTWIWWTGVVLLLGVWAVLLCWAWRWYLIGLGGGGAGAG